MASLKTKFDISYYLVVVVLALFAATPALAQETALEFDPAQSRIGFTLGDVLHTVHGMFRLKSGAIKFDAGTGQASGLMVVDATSGDSGTQSRDHKMHKDILESAQYPEITFTPERVQGAVSPQGDSQVQVSGIFNIHGAGHPLTLIVQVHRAGGQLTADTRFAVPYVSWGLKNPSTFILRVSPTVDIDIHAVGLIKGPAAP